MNLKNLYIKKNIYVLMYIIKLEWLCGGGGGSWGLSVSHNKICCCDTRMHSILDKNVHELCKMSNKFIRFTQ